MQIVEYIYPTTKIVTFCALSIDMVFIAKNAILQSLFSTTAKILSY